MSQPIPLLIADRIFGKKASLLVFRQILPNILPVVHIFSFYKHEVFEEVHWN